ncbi:MAG: hypothetical protein ACK4HE_10990 [Chitinophagaceae bacterium]
MRLSYIILAIALLHTACTRSNDGVTPNTPSTTNPPTVDSIVGTYTGLNFSPLSWTISNNGLPTGGGSDYRGSVTVSKISADSIKIVFNANNGTVTSSFNLRLIGVSAGGYLNFSSYVQTGIPTDVTWSENWGAALFGRGTSLTDLSRVRWGMYANYNLIRYASGRTLPVYQELWTTSPRGESGLVFFK